MVTPTTALNRAPIHPALTVTALDLALVWVAAAEPEAVLLAFFEEEAAAVVEAGTEVGAAEDEAAAEAVARRGAVDWPAICDETAALKVPVIPARLGNVVSSDI